MELQELPGPTAILWRQSHCIQIDDSTTSCRRGRDLEGWGTPPIASCSASHRTTSSNSQTTMESSPTSGTDSTPKGESAATQCRGTGTRRKLPP
jgi:hypothetical protein